MKSASFGRVLGQDGKPAAGVLVRGFVISDQGSSLTGFVRVPIVSTSGSGVVSNNGGSWRLLENAPAVLEARTDADGAFNLVPPAGKAINVEAVRSEELKAFKAEVPAGATGVELRLDFTGQIRGKVTTPTALTVTNHGGVDVYVPGTGYVAKTDDDGSYTIANVPVGTFRLAGSKPGLGSGNLSGVEVKARATTTAPDLALTTTPAVLKGLAPANGGPGTEVTLTGDRFGATDGATFTVSFGGAQATSPTRVDDHTIKARVPASAGSGDVVVAVSDIPSNASPFTVLKALNLASTILDLRAGAMESYELMVSDAAGKPVEAPVVSWASSGPAATVDGQGRVKAGAAGDATITASSGDLKATLALHVAAGPVITTIAGALPKVPVALADGVGELAQFVRPACLALATNGDLLLADGPALRRITPRGVVSTVAGSMQQGEGLGKGKDAQFQLLVGVAMDEAGAAYVSDATTLLRKVLPDGTSQAFAGQAVRGMDDTKSVDGKGALASFRGPGPLVFGPDGTLYMADGSRVRAMTADGTVTTLAGAASPVANTMNAPFIGADGPAASATFGYLSGLALLGQTLYVADGPSLRAIDLAGVQHPVTTVVGGVDPGSNVVSDGAKLYVSSLTQNAIRSWTPGQAALTTLVGGGTNGFADGPLATGRLAGPFGMVADGKGHLYVVDQYNGRIRRVDL
ncbi:MAG: hypothetical protein JWM80_5224 [Cyanobacteria bacterium RYN_339]|nr:hypothetical protein [Cyanobacteria bacterium RYN_339]